MCRSEIPIHPARQALPSPFVHHQETDHLQGPFPLRLIGLGRS
jgi:hypothetical protein